MWATFIVLVMASIQRNDAHANFLGRMMQRLVQVEEVPLTTRNEEEDHNARGDDLQRDWRDTLKAPARKVSDELTPKFQPIEFAASSLNDQALVKENRKLQPNKFPAFSLTNQAIVEENGKLQPNDIPATSLTDQAVVQENGKLQPIEFPASSLAAQSIVEDNSAGQNHQHKIWKDRAAWIQQQ